MKTSFVMYTDWSSMIKKLDEKSRSDLFLAIMCYQTGEDIPDMTPCAEIAFSCIKPQFDKDNSKYEDIVEKRRKAGSLGGKAHAKQMIANEANAFFAKQNVANQADNDNDNVNDNDYVLNTEIERKEINKEREKETRQMVVDYLNEKRGTKFKADSKWAVQNIHARLAEGYVLEDFYRVVDIKVADWAGTKYEKYLTPETLFGNKFDGYLNSAGTPNKPTVLEPTDSDNADAADEELFGPESDWWNA